MKLRTHDRYDYVAAARPSRLHMAERPTAGGLFRAQSRAFLLRRRARRRAGARRAAARRAELSPGATTATASAPGICSTPSMRCSCRWRRWSTARCTTMRPSWWRRYRTRGDEIVGHGRTNAERQGTLDEAAERELIGEATARLTAGRGPRAGRLAGPVDLAQPSSRPTCWPRPATSICSTGAWTTSRSGSDAAAASASWPCPIRRS